ncbi:MAG TPA: hypothetical protein VF267_03635 [Gammaproteobacteria bacterium]
MKTITKILALVAALSLSNAAFAQEQTAGSLGAQLGLGVAGGGDDLADISFDDGSSQTLKAGNGVAYYVGFLKTFENQALALQGTVGYLVDETTAVNSRARMSRYPVDLILFYRNGKHRFGGGLTHHLSPSLDLDNLGGRIDFENATGFLLEYGYWIFSVRYTGIDYTVDGSGGSIDGSSLGVHLTLNY